MLNIISVFIGGGLGAVLRYLAGIFTIKYIGSNFPIATFFVNILGGFIIGFLYIFLTDKTQINNAFKLALTVGFCGGLTTFSTFSLEIFEMILKHQFLQAIIYSAASVILCLTAVAIGIYIAKYL